MITAYINNMKISTQFLITIFLCTKMFSQQGFYQDQNILVIKEDNALNNAWYGGINVPQLSPIDINLDGKLDLFIFDKNGDKISCLLNYGEENIPDYHFKPEFIPNFPELEDWVLLRDFNCDGKNDIFSSYNGGIRVFKNNSLDNLNFDHPEIILTNRGNGLTNLYVSSVDIPHVGDIDYDGDIDILTFSILGSHIEWHKNMSFETFGHCDSLVFELKDECWGKFSENFSDNSVSLNECKNNIIRYDKHSGSTITSIDYNNDSFFDLLLGDITFNNIVYLENSANSENSLMVSQNPNFPENTENINLQRFPAVYHFDFDNDDIKDIIICPNGNNVSNNYENIWFYKNESETNMNLELINKNSIINTMIDVGSGASPSFHDYNNDGLQDLIVANDGYYTENGNMNSKLALYKNIGNLDNPIFEWVTDDYMNLGNLNFETSLKPCFGDIDNDGDDDMIIGDSNGNLHLFTNIISQYNTSNFYVNSLNYFNIDVGNYAHPFLVDLDRDNDLDLIVGSRQGKIYYYDNQGDLNSPYFSLVDETFGNINLTDSIFNTAYTAPFVIDGINGYELFVGSEKGELFHYTNIENDLFGSFNLIQDTLLFFSKVKRLSPSIFDLNNDGWNDMIIGGFTGGLNLLMGCNINEVNLSNRKKNKIKLYPNPFNKEIIIENANSIENLKIFNSSGNILFNGKILDNKILTNNFAKGVYLIIIEDKEGKITKQKMISK